MGHTSPHSRENVPSSRCPPLAVEVSRLCLSSRFVWVKPVQVPACLNCTSLTKQDWFCRLRCETPAKKKKRSCIIRFTTCVISVVSSMLPHKPGGVCPHRFLCERTSIREGNHSTGENRDWQSPRACTHLPRHSRLWNGIAQESRRTNPRKWGIFWHRPRKKNS